jgi:hypothetical protein
MDPIIRPVRGIDAADRQALEHVLGRRLEEDQEVIIRVATPKRRTPTRRPKGKAVPRGRLPAWCDVFAGMTDQQIKATERVILRRADLTRASD